ncbi:MAG: TIGR02147 family protein [Bdellovibrionota bacterium]
MQNSSPQISDFIDLVDYLKCYYEWRKNLNSKFSYGMWQEELGIVSRTLLRLVLNRKRRVSPKTAVVLKSNLQLSLKDSHYFDLLLSYTQAKTQTERRSIGENLLRTQRAMYQPLHLNPDVGSDDVFKPIVLALMTYKDMKFTNASLATLLELEPMRIQNILKSSLDQKIIFVDSNGVYSFPFEGFKISDALGNMNLKNFYRFWLEKAKEALDLPFESRRYRALEFALSNSEFVEVQEQIAEFATQILGRYKSTSMIGRRLYMLENVLMPISQEFSEKIVDDGEVSIS